MFKHGYLPTTFHFKYWLTEGLYFTYFFNCLITLAYLFKLGCNHTLLFSVTAFRTTYLGIIQKIVQTYIKPMKLFFSVHRFSNTAKKYATRFTNI